jgi:hypothetical protein
MTSVGSKAFINFVPIVLSSIILTSAPLRLCAILIPMPVHLSFCYAIYGRPPSPGAEIAGNSSRLLCSFFENHKL